MSKPSGRRTSQFQLPSGQPQPSKPTLEKNFVAGLKTEFTGLNFPENACTATSNCVFNRIGNVTRRKGIDYELGFINNPVGIGNAISSYVWTNAGGDGNTQIYVVQSGSSLYFYLLTSTTSTSSAISSTLLGSIITLTSVPGGTFDNTKECQFTSGNGYLFVFHPSCNPFYCTFSTGVVSSFPITINIRDFAGIFEPGIADNNRPSSLSAEHQYNIQNQGWSSQGVAWGASSTTQVIPGGTSPVAFTIGNNSFQVASGIVGIVVSQSVTVTGYALDAFHNQYPVTGSGIVGSYSGTTLVISIMATSSFAGTLPAFNTQSWNIAPTNTGLISTWVSALGNYPSNADQWWQFKNASGVYSPSTTAANVTLATGPAPKGAYIFNAFAETRSAISGVAGLTDVTTSARPRTGAWFQGRVWYAGVDASFNATGDEPFQTWTENIYFSQIVQNTSQFGRCYQTNDPTSETLFELLPTDGGVIVIQGSGSIYKLFTIQNGLLVFAANGIWFITGTQGIGFTASDYTITKISGIKSISGTSIIDVLGYPIFWNNDGIYMLTADLQQAQVALGGAHAGLSVNNLTLPTIQTFFQSIPLDSKKFARGDYNPITGIMQWCYRSTQEGGVSNRYMFDSILNFNVFTQAFYPWAISSPAGGPNIVDIKYLSYSQINSPPTIFKYLTLTGSSVTFSEEKDNVFWVDWGSTGFSTNYVSNFITAYHLSADAMRRFQPEYVYMFSNNLVSTSYKINGIWNFGATPNSGRWSTTQLVNNNLGKFSGLSRRHRIRGQGNVLQFQINSTDGKPFDLMGWAVLETQNVGI